MSEQEETKDLPTAAYEWRYEDWEEGHTVLRHDEPENSFDVELSLEAELVQRKDLPPKWECGFCNHVFRSRLEQPRCPDCGQANWQCYKDQNKVELLEEVQNQ